MKDSASILCVPVPPQLEDEWEEGGRGGFCFIIHPLYLWEDAQASRQFHPVLFSFNRFPNA